MRADIVPGSVFPGDRRLRWPYAGASQRALNGGTGSNR
jgi:hypothetical protein